MGWILIIIMEKGVMKKGINGTVVKGNNRTTIPKNLNGVDSYNYYGKRCYEKRN